MPSNRRAAGKVQLTDNQELDGRISELSKHFQEEMGKFRAEMCQKVAEEENPAPGDLYSRFNNFEKVINHEISTLRVEISSLNSRLDDVESKFEIQLRRQNRNKLIIHGVNDVRSESVEQLVEKTINALNSSSKNGQICIDRIDIGDCYRVGKINSTYRRPVVVEFIYVLKRNAVFQCKSSLKGTDISISEFLTKRTYHLYQEVRKTHKRDCWTMNGLIYVKHNNVKKLIKSVDDIH